MRTFDDFAGDVRQKREAIQRMQAEILALQDGDISFGILYPHNSMKPLDSKYVDLDAIIGDLVFRRDHMKENLISMIQNQGFGIQKRDL